MTHTASLSKQKDAWDTPNRSELSQLGRTSKSQQPPAEPWLISCLPYSTCLVLQVMLLDRLQDLSWDTQLPQHVRDTLSGLRKQFRDMARLILPKDERLTDEDRRLATPDFKKVLRVKLHSVHCKHAISF